MPNAEHHKRTNVLKTAYPSVYLYTRKMEEKDDFDIFIEKAENLVRLIEAGEDVEQEKEKLLEEAHRVDPSTVPSTSVEPVLVCKVLANLKYPSNSQIFQDTRKCEKVKLPNQNNILTNSLSRSNLSLCYRISICILIVSLLSFYYFNLPPPCPRPIW